MAHSAAPRCGESTGSACLEIAAGGVIARDDTTCGIATVFVVHHREWLRRQPDREQWCIDTMLNAVAAPRQHEFVGARVGTEWSWESFCAQALPPIWAERPGDPMLRHAVAQLALRPSYHTVAGGKRRSGKTRKGSKWLRATLAEASMAATKTKDSYLAAQYQRLRGRRGPAKAVTAVGHSILTAAWHMLQTGELYHELGGDYYTRQNPDRTTKRLVRQLEALGHIVTLQTATSTTTAETREVAA